MTTQARLPQLPDVPALAETLPGFNASGWSGIVAPGAAELGGCHELTMSPDDFATFIAAETAKWAKVVKFAGRSH